MKGRTWLAPWPSPCSVCFDSTNPKKNQLYPLNLYLLSSTGNLESVEKTLQTVTYAGEHKEPREGSSGSAGTNDSSKNGELDVPILIAFNMGNSACLRRSLPCPLHDALPSPFTWPPASSFNAHSMWRERRWWRDSGEPSLLLPAHGWDT